MRLVKRIIVVSDFTNYAGTDSTQFVVEDYSPYQCDNGKWRWGIHSWDAFSREERYAEMSAIIPSVRKVPNYYSFPMTNEELQALDMLAKNRHDLIAKIPGLFVVEK